VPVDPICTRGQDPILATPSTGDRRYAPGIALSDVADQDLSRMFSMQQEHDLTAEMERYESEGKEEMGGVGASEEGDRAAHG